jgi:hypothetical protein
MTAPPHKNMLYGLGPLWGRDSRLLRIGLVAFCLLLGGAEQQKALKLKMMLRCNNFVPNIVCSESRGALRLRYVDLVVSIEVAVEVCCCFTVFSC